MLNTLISHTFHDTNKVYLSARSKIYMDAKGYVRGSKMVTI
jgi:hypothetical protein